MEESFYRVKEIAKKLDVTPRTVQNLVKAKKLGAVRVGKIIRITEKHFQEFLERYEISVEKKSQ